MILGIFMALILSRKTEDMQQSDTSQIWICRSKDTASVNGANALPTGLLGRPVCDHVKTGECYQSLDLFLGLKANKCDSQNVKPFPLYEFMSTFLL